MTPEHARFESWVAPARARPELWRLALGLAITVAVWIAIVLAFGAAIATSGARMAVLGFLGSFAGLILGVALALRWLHRRGLESVIGAGGFRPQAFVTGVAVVAGLAALTALPALALDPPERRMALGAWLAWLPLAAPAVMIQVSAEELMFRGYLQQQLAARFRSRLIWLVAPAAVFGALHWNPTFGPNVWAVAAAAAVTGLVYGDVTAREGNLSAAIGLHFANNAVALLVAAPEGPLGTFALWRAPVGPEDVAGLRAALAAQVGVTALAYAVYRAALARRARSLHSRGPGSI